MGGQRVGTFRAVDHSGGNLLIERRNKILKWPKCKTRLANLENRDAMGRIPVPANARLWKKRHRRSPEEYPEEYQPDEAYLPEHEIAIPDNIDLRDQPLSKEELMDIGQRALNAPEQDSYGPEDSHDVGIVFGGQQTGHVGPGERT